MLHFSPSRTLKTIALSLGVLATLFLASVVVLAWTDPSQTPPGANVPAPINVGPTAQTKAGALTIAGGGGDALILRNGGDLRLYNAANSGSALLYVDNNGEIITPGNLTVGGEMRANRVYGFADIRSPIFYDYNNTGYYVDPASNSRLGNVYADYLYSYGNADANDYYIRAIGKWASQLGTISSCAECDDRFVNVTGDTMTGRLYHNEWIQFNNYTGLYSPLNGAHLYPNNGSYGSWRVAGSRNGWYGLEFDTVAGQTTFMMGTTGQGWGSQMTGVHNNSYGWLWRWDHGTLAVGTVPWGNVSKPGNLTYWDTWYGSSYLGSNGDLYMGWDGRWLSQTINQDVRGGASPTFGTVYTSNWFRSTGNSGWYSESYGGGWWMTDATWIRTYNSKSVWTDTGLLGSNGGLTIGYGGTTPPSGGAIIAGSVGIGTTSPGYKLDVYNDLAVGTSGWARLQLYSSVNDTYNPLTGGADTAHFHFAFPGTPSGKKPLLEIPADVWIIGGDKNLKVDGKVKASNYNICYQLQYRKATDDNWYSSTASFGNWVTAAGYDLTGIKLRLYACD